MTNKYNTIRADYDLQHEIDPWRGKRLHLEALISAGPDAAGNFFAYAPACPRCGDDVVYNYQGQTRCAECGHERVDLYQPCACVLPEQHCRACEGAARKAN